MQRLVITDHQEESGLNVSRSWVNIRKLSRKPPTTAPSEESKHLRRARGLHYAFVRWSACCSWLYMMEDRNPNNNPQQEVVSVSQPNLTKVNPKTTSDASPSDECPNTRSSKARQSTAALLQKIYEKEGRMLTVTAAGEHCEILELSGMLAQGNYTFDAAQSETIGCSHCMLLYKKAKFKAIHFIGAGMNAEYPIQ